MQRAQAPRKGAPPPRSYVKLPLVTVAESLTPIFSRRPPWWARNPGTAGLILCDILVTGAFIELTWNHWTEAKIIPPAEADTNTQSEDGQTGGGRIEWDLRPQWQRFGLCAAHFVFGCFFAGGLLGLKSQFIRSVTILPSSASTAAATGSKKVSSAAATTLPTRALIQTAGHPRNTGWEFPIHSSWLEEGRDKNELQLRNSEANSRWFLGLDGASIYGKHCVSRDEARASLINAWRALQPASSAALKPAGSKGKA